VYCVRESSKDKWEVRLHAVVSVWHHSCYWCSCAAAAAAAAFGGVDLVQSSSLLKSSSTCCLPPRRHCRYHSSLTDRHPAAPDLCLYRASGPRSSGPPSAPCWRSARRCRCDKRSSSTHLPHLPLAVQSSASSTATAAPPCICRSDRSCPLRASCRRTAAGRSRHRRSTLCRSVDEAQISPRTVRGVRVWSTCSARKMSTGQTYRRTGCAGLAVDSRTSSVPRYWSADSWLTELRVLVAVPDCGGPRAREADDVDCTTRWRRRRHRRHSNLPSRRRRDRPPPLRQQPPPRRPASPGCSIAASTSSWNTNSSFGRRRSARRAAHASRTTPAVRSADVETTDELSVRVESCGDEAKRRRRRSERGWATGRERCVAGKRAVSTARVIGRLWSARDVSVSNTYSLITELHLSDTSLLQLIIATVGNVAQPYSNRWHKPLTLRQVIASFICRLSLCRVLLYKHFEVIYSSRS